MTQQLTTNLIDNSLEVIQNGGKILQANKLRSDKALTVGKSIIEAIEADGMTPELDTRANNFLANCRKAKEEMNEARKPVTQILDAIKSEFTASENALDVSKADSLPFKVQTHRNAYVKKLKEEEDKKRKDAEDKANLEREKIEIKAQLESLVNTHVNNALLVKKTSINSAFNNITLANYEEKANGLKTMVVKGPVDILQGFAPGLRVKYLTAEDARLIEEEVFKPYRTNDPESEFAKRWIAEIVELKNELIEKLPSKKTELDTIAKASADDKAKLEQQQKDRKLAEEKRLKEVSDKAIQDAQQKIDMDKVANETQVLFDKEAATISDGPAPETRSGFNIKVLHPIGYTQIYQLWFEKEGKNLPIDKIGNTKLDQMKAWCEKLAHKTGEKIDSAYLTYEIDTKAVNKKVK